jgi:hypothetical protein
MNNLQRITLAAVATALSVGLGAGSVQASQEETGLCKNKSGIDEYSWHDFGSQGDCYKYPDGYLNESTCDGHGHYLFGNWFYYHFTC